MCVKMTVLKYVLVWSYVSYNINTLISFFSPPQTDTIVNKNVKHYVHIPVTVLKLNSETSPSNTAMPLTKPEKQ
jgi:hypothetical protein